MRYWNGFGSRLGELISPMSDDPNPSFRLRVNVMPAFG